MKIAARQNMCVLLEKQMRPWRSDVKRRPE
jgi:hypothetical protein